MLTRLFSTSPSLQQTSADREMRRSSNPAWPSVVLLLTLIYICNFVDRQIIYILGEPIKQELGLHDWQLGMLSGASFAIAYGIMAIPFARLAERVNRPRLIAWSLAVWSGASAGCAYASGFGQLAGARTVVAASEAGYTPAAHALITDYAPIHRRTLALGIFSTGAPIGGMVAMIGGGIIADLFGWRVAFLAAGIPGILLAFVVGFAIKEVSERSRPEKAEKQMFSAAAKELWGRKSFRRLLAGSALIALSTYGIQAFTASFFLRLHAEELDKLAHAIRLFSGINLSGTGILGPALGLAMGLAGIIGMVIGGLLTDRLVARNERNFAWAAATPPLVAFPLLLVAFMAMNFWLACLALALQTLLYGLYEPTRLSCLQGLASSRTRATASAFTLLGVVMFGNGLGPLLVGGLSDSISQMGMSSGDALRVALIIGAIPSIVGAILFFSMRGHLAKDLADAGGRTDS